jgi:hypothetical protein
VSPLLELQTWLLQRSAANREAIMRRLACRTFAFELEHIRAMHEAFDAVCGRLQLSTGSKDRVTELVGEKIIELAVAGEQDANSRSCARRVRRRE